MENILKISQVSKTYRAAGRALNVLENIDFSVEAGSTVAIVGPSGSGKTTLLGLSAGLDRCTTGAVGLITEATQAEEIVGSGKADVVLLAREMLRDPYWALHAAKVLGVDVEWPKQYRRAK